MLIIRTLLAALILCSLPLMTLAQHARLPVEVWADSLQVSELDMSPDAQRMAMLMRRERGAHPDLIVFDTDDIQGSLQAIQPEGLIPIGLGWANDDFLIVNFILESVHPLGHVLEQRHGLITLSANPPVFVLQVVSRVRPAHKALYEAIVVLLQHRHLAPELRNLLVFRHLPRREEGRVIVPLTLARRGGARRRSTLKHVIITVSERRAVRTACATWPSSAEVALCYM